MAKPLQIGFWEESTVFKHRFQTWHSAAPSPSLLSRRDLLWTSWLSISSSDELSGSELGFSVSRIQVRDAIFKICQELFDIASAVWPQHWSSESLSHHWSIWQAINWGSSHDIWLWKTEDWECSGQQKLIIILLYWWGEDQEELWWVHVLILWDAADTTSQFSGLELCERWA